ncbi:MAG: MBL fold metallo-hydrolase [Gammaproteobacteria bacterium]|nr:MBL fold metallo-hydrolase [Gammaproteobacteria bacterium]
MNFSIIPVTPFEQNCSLIWCDETGKAAVVDPGGDLDVILAEVASRNLTLEKILITHAHIDHAGGAGELARNSGVPIEGPHQDDLFWIEGMLEQGRMFDYSGAEVFEPTRWLQQGDQVSVGNLLLDVHHCPGHTPGHVIFFHAASKLAIVGDVLFKGGIGRTDFPKGDLSMLLTSIRERLWPLGDDVKFVSGHGPMSTIGFERAHNPFLN